MNRKILSSIVFIWVMVSVCSAQISGTVVDENGQAVQFVNIYIENTTSGTSSNAEGNYILDLPIGKQNIAFQYIGYKKLIKEINYTGDPILFDLEMVPEAYSLDQITISANGEDPAYAIIRKAQAKRTYYQDQIPEYACNVYIKGNQKVLDAPTKIFGQEIGDLDGSLDTNRQGIVYLSETLSRLYVKDGEQKEIIKSSKVSGNDQGYSFNSARDMDARFYDNSMELGRAIVSPIARNAMSFYKYKLLGAQMDENGLLINQIRVEPKKDNLPAYSGEIYIIEDLWNIHSLDLVIGSKGMSIPLIDSLRFKQSFVPARTLDEWVLFSNVIAFKIDAFGFSFDGQFGAIFSDYDFSKVDPTLFNDEVYFVEKGSNEKTEDYWNEIRPIPLSNEEELDYVKKDSIRIVRESPEYLDSIDRDSNKFKIGNLIAGYNRQNSTKHTFFQFDSPLSHFSYNTVQGYKFQLGLSAYKSSNKYGDHSISWSANVDYGFTEEIWRPTFSVGYFHDRINRFGGKLAFGRQLSQYNKEKPISDFINLIETLFSRRNYMKLYDDTFAELTLERYLSNSLHSEMNIKYANRNPLINHSDISYFHKDSRDFTINFPFENASIPYFEEHDALTLSTRLKFVPGQKVYRYPDHKIRVGNSKFPTITLDYEMGIKAFGTQTDFAKAKVSLTDNFSIGSYGSSQYLIAAGDFLWKNDLEFIDYTHFLGNESLFDLSSQSASRFLSLPYYDLSTQNAFVHVSYKHDFEGYILDRVPLLNKLGWQLLGSAKYLHLQGGQDYLEYSVGLDNIGFGIFKILQLHGVWSHYDQSTDFRLVIGARGDF